VVHWLKFKKDGHLISRRPRSARSSGGSCLLIAIYRMDNLIEMRIDFVRQLIEVTPLLAKFGRFMRRSQQLPILPLNVVDDAPAIQAAM